MKQVKLGDHRGHLMIFTKQIQHLKPMKRAWLLQLYNIHITTYQVFKLWQVHIVALLKWGKITQIKITSGVYPYYTIFSNSLTNLKNIAQGLLKTCFILYFMENSLFSSKNIVQLQDKKLLKKIPIQITHILGLVVQFTFKGRKNIWHLIIFQAVSNTDHLFFRIKSKPNDDTQ